MIEEIMMILWHPVVIFLAVAIPVGLIAKHFITEHFIFYGEKEKYKNIKTKESGTITGQLEIALRNPDLAYQQLKGEMNECDKMIEEFKNEEKMKKVWINKRKGLEWKFNFVTKILENKSYVDLVGVDTLIPIMKGTEKKIRGLFKTFAGGVT